MVKKSKKSQVEQAEEENPVTIAEAVEDEAMKTVKKKKKGDKHKKSEAKDSEAERMEAVEDGEQIPTQSSSKKRKNAKKAAEDVPSKKPKTVEGSKSTYVPGGLAGLFGKSTDDVEAKVATEFFRGEATIKVTPTEKKTVKAEGEESTKGKKTKNESTPEKNRTKQREKLKEIKARQRDSLNEKKLTIFVGNVSITHDEKMIKKIFSEYGAIESVRMRSVMAAKETLDKRITYITKEFHEKQKSVNFYVKFKDEESVKKALAYSGTIVDGHRIRVDVCVGNRDYDKNSTVYVGNLPFDAAEDAVAAVFEEHTGEGSVQFVRVVKDAATGMGKGFAFVCFKSATSVPMALTLTELKFAKRKLRVTKVMKKVKVKTITQAHKKNMKKEDANKKATQNTKVDNYKFSTKKKNRTDEQTERRKLKKTALKAIHRKKTSKQSRSLMH